MSFSTAFIPEIRFSAGGLSAIGEAATSLASRSVLVIMDSFLAQNGLGDKVLADLTARGLNAALFSDFAGEPKLAHLRAALAVAKDRELVIGIGGGSALDISKIVACAAVTGQDPMHYALAANPLPAHPMKKILVPTTAGTGSETSSTCIFAGPDGKKMWIWGPETKADLVILDPELTYSLPPALTAWCGMDAFIHAFEASTNRNTHRGAQFYGHEAMRLMVRSLETAVRDPKNEAARGDVLLGSCYAGIAIDNCGTAIAHNVSHALAGLGPVHHGLATALGFEATLAWLAEAKTSDLQAAAEACGLADASELSAFFTRWMDACGVERSLPAAFKAFTAADLAREMKAPENQPMRRSTIRDVSDADIDRFAAAIMALA